MSPPHDVLGGRAGAGRGVPLLSRRAQSSSTVVDPGVGSARRGIAAEAGDYRFVAPDNGVLTARARRDAAAKKVVELTERRYARPTVSRTFEGRDRFAPAAAWLAKGIELAALGRPAGSGADVSTSRGREIGCRRRSTARCCASIGSAT